MELTSFAVRIAILLLPGVFASKVYRKLRGQTKKAYWQDFIEILVFSVISYTLLAGSITVVHWVLANKGSAADEAEIAQVQAEAEKQPPIDPLAARADDDPAEETEIAQIQGEAEKQVPIDPLAALADQEAEIRWEQVLIASGIGVLLGFLGGYVHNFSLVNWLGRHIRATKRGADEDVWQMFFDSKKVTWVLVRDHSRDLAYFGFVSYYSDSGDTRELALESVDVYTNDGGDSLYSCDAVYISRPSDQLSIEVPDGLYNMSSGNTLEPKEKRDGEED